MIPIAKLRPVASRIAHSYSCKPAPARVHPDFRKRSHEFVAGGSKTTQFDIPRFQMRFASKLKYTKDHEWIKVENNIGTVGITDFAQNALGEVVYVDLPDVGRKVQKKETVIAVESVKAASDVYAPVSGEVSAVNESLSKEPGLVNKSPFGDGWMLKLKLSNTKELDELLDEAAYKKHCEVETH